MAYRHSRTPSSTSDIHLTGTVSYLQRCVCGNMFRSQKQLSRFFLCVAVVMLFLYLVGPFDSAPRKHKGSRITSTPASDGAKQVETQYRARFFEEIGRRMGETLEDGKSDKTLEVNLQEIAEKVKRVAESISKCRDVPGLTAVMVKGDKSVLFSLGLADVKTGRAVNSETRFLLNSISKTFLGQLLVILVNEAPSNITLDTPVSTILGPDFRLATEELTHEVTLRDLMSHRSGLSSGNLAVRATYPAGWTRSDLVRQLHHLPPSTPFRKSFLYSNMGGMLAAHVAEKLGGAPWEKLIVEKLLVPLGMVNSRPVQSHAELSGADFARPYVPVDGRLTECDTKIFDQGPLSAVALLSTTASDMAKWIRFNLRQGRLENGKQLISPDTWSDMWTRQARLSPMFLRAMDKSSSRWPVHDVSEGYGLFWFINKYRGLWNFWHGGGLYSHYGLTWTFPENEVGLYIAINGFSGDSKPFAIVESLAYYTTDLLLGYQPWLDESSVCQYPEFWASDSKTSHHNYSMSDKSSTGVQNKPVNLQKEDGVQESIPDKLNLTSQLLVDNSRLSESAREKLEAVAASYAKLTTPYTPGKAEGSDPSSQASRSHDPSGQLRGTLARKTREAGPQSAAEQFEIRHGSDGFSRVEAVHVAQKNDLETLKSNKPLKVAEPVRPPTELQTAKRSVYDGRYSHPLIGNVTVFTNNTTGHLQCEMNVLTGHLLPKEGHVFGLELTGRLRFLSKPSRQSPAKQVFKIEFVEGTEKEIVGLDFHSTWAMEVPLRFSKLR